MTLLEYRLDEETPELTTMPFNLYCARSKCNTIIRKGAPALRYDAATYTHDKCPETPFRHFAAHKHPEAKDYL